MTLIKVELFKLMKKRSTKIFIGVYSMILLGIAFLYVIAENMLELSLYSGLQFTGASLSIMMVFMLPFMAIFLSGQSQALDFIHGAMKNMYLLPVSRTKIFLSKLFAVWMVIGGLLAGHFIFSLSVSLIVDGVHGLGFFMFLSQYLGALVVLGLVSLIGNALALLVKNTGLAIIIAYASFVGLRLISMYIPMIKSVSITTVIANYHMLFNFSSLNVLLSTIAYYIMIFVAGLLLFEKKEESLCQFD